MAAFTTLAKRTTMRIILLMAGGTTAGGTNKIIVEMTFPTVHISMCAGQLEAGELMVKGSRYPAIGCMAVIAQFSKFSMVRIIFIVAGGAVGWSTLVNIINMALQALHLAMRTGQLKGRELVVKGSRFPADGTVAGLTLRTQPAPMLIILFMAGETLHRSALKYFVIVALRASHAIMLANQLELGPGMIKFGR